mgnify:CR=1 FL=1
MLLNDNPSIDELRAALVKVANGEEVDNSQINAIKALISLKLNEKRLSFAKSRLEKAGIFANELEQDSTMI